MRPLVAALLLCIVSASAAADDLLLARISRPFPETMNDLQAAIRDKGYVVSRVQRVDIGLTASGFPTAEYRVVFFGRADEIRSLAAAHPELIPYLPLNIVVLAEGDDTLVVTIHPRMLAELFDDSELRPQFARWEQDIQGILAELRRGP